MHSPVHLKLALNKKFSDVSRQHVQVIGLKTFVKALYSKKAAV